MKDDMQDHEQICKKAAKCLSHLSCLTGFFKNLEHLSRVVVRLVVKKAFMSPTLHTFLGTLEQTWPVYTIHLEGKT